MREMGEKMGEEKRKGEEVWWGRRKKKKEREGDIQREESEKENEKGRYFGSCEKNK